MDRVILDNKHFFFLQHISLFPYNCSDCIFQFVSLRLREWDIFGVTNLHIHIHF